MNSEVSVYLSKKNPKNKKLFQKLEDALKLKRNRLKLTIKKIKNMTISIPALSPNSEEPPKLFYNIFTILNAIVLSLIKYNGDFEDLNDSFLELVSLLSFDLLKQGSTLVIKNFNETKNRFINKLGSANNFFEAKSLNNVFQILDQEILKIFKGKFLLCEVLFVLYEAVLINLNQDSKILLSQEEKM